MIALSTAAPAYSQTAEQSSSTTATGVPVFEGITIGEPLGAVRDRLGDPLTIKPIDSNGGSIWRYLSQNGAVYIDVLTKENVAYSITVVARFAASTYRMSDGIAFGMRSEDVRAKLGPPTRTTTNQDDGSVDLWYLGSGGAWIYEFHADRLDFIQLIPPHGSNSLSPGPPVVPADGSSFDKAVRVVQPFMVTPFWINTYLAMNPCGSGARWETSKGAQRSATYKNVDYAVVHASCSDGSIQRDFFFDTSYGLKAVETAAQTNASGASNVNVAPSTIYVDVSTMDGSGASAAAPGVRSGTSFDGAIVIRRPPNAQVLPPKAGTSTSTRAGPTDDGQSKSGRWYGRLVRRSMFSTFGAAIQARPLATFISTFVPSPFPHPNAPCGLLSFPQTGCAPERL